VLTYFAGIGFGYLFIELMLMQKSALLLGHPTYSVSVTLVSLLLGSGFGSLRVGAGRPERVRTAMLRACLIVVLTLAVSAVGLGPLFRAALAWPFAMRVVLLACSIFVMGWAMGRPFPLAMHALSGGNPRVLAWAQAMNSFASVVASLLAVPIAIFGGFNTVAGVAAGCYLVAASCGLLIGAAETRNAHA
jgi:hypothetical protein